VRKTIDGSWRCARHVDLRCSVDTVTEDFIDLHMNGFDAPEDPDDLVF
jgi:hypothetical protein